MNKFFLFIIFLIISFLLFKYTYDLKKENILMLNQLEYNSELYNNDNRDLTKLRLLVEESLPERINIRLNETKICLTKIKDVKLKYIFLITNNTCMACAEEIMKILSTSKVIDKFIFIVPSQICRNLVIRIPNIKYYCLSSIDSEFINKIEVPIMFRIDELNRFKNVLIPSKLNNDCLIEYLKYVNH